MKIFLLEDDPIYQDLLLSDLEDEGYEIVTHECVQGAAEKIKEGGFDLLLVDIMIPETAELAGCEIRDGGIRILENLAAESYQLPVTFFVSVYGFEENSSRIEALNLNGNAPDIQMYFRKPYNFDSLLQSIKKIEELTGK